MTKAESLILVLIFLLLTAVKIMFPAENRKIREQIIYTLESKQDYGQKIEAMGKNFVNKGLNTGEYDNPAALPEIGYEKLVSPERAEIVILDAGENK